MHAPMPRAMQYVGPQAPAAKLHAPTWPNPHARVVRVPLAPAGSRALFGFTFSRDFLLGVPLVMLAILLYGGACDPCIGSAAVVGPAPATTAAEASQQRQRLLEEDESDEDGSPSNATLRGK